MAPTTPRTVMWTVSQIASRDGVSKQAVSKKVKELAGLGLAVCRNENGHVAAVNVVDYDRLRGRTDDPSKAQAPGRATGENSAAGPLHDAESYDEALRQKTWHEAERQRLNLEERKGALLVADKVEDGAVAAGVAIAEIIDRLPNLTDDILVVAVGQGAHGLRVELKKIAFRMRTQVADAMQVIAAAAPKTDVPEPDESDSEAALSS